MNEERASRLNRLSARLFKDKEPAPVLEVDRDGLSYVRTGGRTTVRWTDVKEIFAFKRDIFAVDLICIGFRISDDGRYWEIDEEMSGYEAVLAEMSKTFGDLDPKWWERAAFPPFKTNLVTLWGRPRIAAIWQSD